MSTHPRIRAVVAGLAALLLLAGCGQSQPAAQVPTAPGPASAPVRGVRVPAGVLQANLWVRGPVGTAPAVTFIAPGGERVATRGRDGSRHVGQVALLRGPQPERGTANVLVSGAIAGVWRLQVPAGTTVTRYGAQVLQARGER